MSNTETETKSELAAALAAPSALHYAGRDRAVKPLDFNSLIKIEDRFGNLDAIDFDKAKNQRFLVFVILSAADPDLTEEAVGELLTFKNLKETAEFIAAAFRLSGLIPEASEVGEVGKPKATKPKA